jgi:WD40 repeat protein
MYECLTGRPPFQAATAAETLLQVLAEEPTPPRLLRPDLPRDLETICLKCLAKEPARRYTSAAALAHDLAHFLAGEPIEARPAGALERTLRWMKRRPAAAALVGVSLAALLILLGGGVLFTQQLRVERNLAREQETVARKQETLARKELERSRRMLFTAQVRRVAAVWERDPLHGLDLLEDPLRCPPDLRDFAWGFYHRLCRRHRRTLAGHRQPVKAAAFHPGGAILATAGGRFTDKGQAVPGEIKLWDLATGRDFLGLEPPGGEVTSLAFSPDGKVLVSGSGEKVGNKSAGLVTLWEVPTGRERVTLRGHDGWVNSVAFSPDGKTIASASADQTIKLWDAASGKERLTLRGHRGGVNSVAFSPDGKTIASGGGSGQDGEVKLWDAGTGKELATLRGPGGTVTRVAFSQKDGKTLASGSYDYSVRLWDVPARQQRLVLPVEGPVWDLALSKDGKSLAAGTWEGYLKLWDAATGQERASIKGHTAYVECVAFSVDGKLLASGSGRHSLTFDVQLWDVVTGPERAILPPDEAKRSPVEAVAFSPDGKILAAATEVGVRRWDPGTGTERDTLLGQGQGKKRFFSVAFSGDGRTLAASQDNRTYLWDADTGRQRATFAGGRMVALDREGKVLAVAPLKGPAQV